MQVTAELRLIATSLGALSNILLKALEMLDKEKTILNQSSIRYLFIIGSTLGV
jgi:hypothetical protein